MLGWTRVCAPAGQLCFARAARDRQVEIQDLSSRQAAAFNVVPAAKHLRGDAEILCHRLNRIALAYLVMRGGAGVSAGVRLFAGSDRDDQPALGREAVVSCSAV